MFSFCLTDSFKVSFGKVQNEPPARSTVWTRLHAGRSVRSWGATGTRDSMRPAHPESHCHEAIWEGPGVQASGKRRGQLHSLATSADLVYLLMPCWEPVVGVLRDWNVGRPVLGGRGAAQVRAARCEGLRSSALETAPPRQGRGGKGL